jgi:D-alanyl-lipoteichoic acid acyltransferase DltB (MBOAT superfamily)
VLFNSTIFIAFFATVYPLYLLLRRHLKAQNLLLLVASYVFYGAWDWRFLFLLALSTLIDYYAALRIHDSDDAGQRKRFLIVSMVSNLTLLGFFKYFNFFQESLVRLLNVVGMQPDWVTLNVILPVGISFYTFQSMSYAIDVYRRHLTPTRSLVDFALFVALFPQLVAGPIERATHLLPQIIRPRRVLAEEVNAGLYLILLGYFKKVVVADHLAINANTIFNQYESFHGLDLALGTLAFTFQIYGDFSGYSDIARGISKLMGFELMVNFREPYLASNPSDFWTRWHISLSTWLRDNLYIPLGGNRRGAARTYRNLALTMVLGGLWHGAAWNFVIWGAYHGALLIAYRLASGYGLREPAGRLSLAARIAVMFVLTNIGWILFRARSAEQIVYFVSQMGFGTSARTVGFAYDLLFFAGPLVLLELWQYVARDGMVVVRKPLAFRICLYAAFVVWILVFGVRESMEFIYFQF